MIRILIYILLVIAAAGIITFLADVSGFAVIRWEGTQVELPTALLVGLGIIAALTFFFSGQIVSWTVGLPARLRRRAEDNARARGMMALTRGLEAVAAGDAADAQRHARAATKNLDEPALTRLLTAQAAQLAGDRVTAEAAYAGMLEAPETEFLGLRGLYLHALASGDQEEARAFAERAFELRPGTSWAFESVLSLGLERGAWGDAIDAITRARQNGAADGPEFKRIESALLTAQAFAASESDDHDTALKDAEAALKKAPSLTPAAAIAAESEVRAGRRSRAVKILGDAWAAEPHPGLAAVMRRIFEHERDERIAGRLMKLAEKKPEHPESQLLLAQVQLDGGQADAAQETLAPLIKGRASRRVLSLMADITETRYGADAAGPWRMKAANAPLDIIPGQDGDFQYTTEGWRRLIREFGEHARLAPPPLEVEAPELDIDEVRALLAPPPEDATPEPDEESGEGDDDPTASLHAVAENDATMASDDAQADDTGPDDTATGDTGTDDTKNGDEPKPVAAAS
ncbi:MAG: heme biosynthesis HemY N-terminal domain-containing protein [Pseudomonadota bacterium]